MNGHNLGIVHIVRAEKRMNGHNLGIVHMVRAEKRMNGHNLGIVHIVRTEKRMNGHNLGIVYIYLMTVMWKRKIKKNWNHELRKCHIFRLIFYLSYHFLSSENLEREYSELRKRAVCQKCEKKVKDILFLPCHHLVYCKCCFLPMTNNLCPVCGNEIKGTISAHMTK